MDGRVEPPGADIRVPPFRTDCDGILRWITSVKPAGQKILGQTVRARCIDISNAGRNGGIEHFMAPSLEVGDAAARSQVALPSEIDVGRSPERGQTQTETAHREAG